MSPSVELLRSVVPRPEYQVPALPEDITTISDAELMSQLRMQTEWANFFGAQLVEREKVEAEALNAYEIAKAGAFDTTAKTVAAGKSAAATNPVVEAAYQRWHTAKYDRKAMETVMKSRDSLASIVSREVTRRVGRDGPQRRADRYGGG